MANATPTRRGLVHYVLASLMVAEERITTKFTGLVGAVNRGGGHLPGHPAGGRSPSHAVLRPLPGRGVAPRRDRRPRRAIPGALSCVRQIFDLALVPAHERLLAAPADLTPRSASSPSTTRFSRARLDSPHSGSSPTTSTRTSCSPGSSRATPRSITTKLATSATASGTCSRTLRTTPSSPTQSARRLRGLLPAAAEALAPPGSDGTDWEALGAGSADISSFALSGLTRRLDIIGVPLATL